ncbi:MAG: hypothetical protein AB1351_09985 [Thermoproteota archaeon]
MKTKKNRHANKKSDRQRKRLRRRSKSDVPPNRPLHKQGSRIE